MVEKSVTQTKGKGLKTKSHVKQWYVIAPLVLLVVSIGLYVFEGYMISTYNGYQIIGERYQYARFIFGTSILFLITAVACGIAITKSKGWWKVLFILGLLFGLYSGVTQMITSFYVGSIQF